MVMWFQVTTLSKKLRFESCLSKKSTKKELTIYAFSELDPQSPYYKKLQSALVEISVVDQNVRLQRVHIRGMIIKKDRVFAS